MDCSPPGSSVHGILQAGILEWVAISFCKAIFPTQGSNLGLLCCRRILYGLSHQGSHNSYNVLIGPTVLWRGGVLLGYSVLRNPSVKCRRPGFSPWIRKIPCRRKWQPTPASLPEKSHRQRRLVGYSPWGHKESDMTEQLNNSNCTIRGLYKQHPVRHSEQVAGQAELQTPSHRWGR